jgi:hypothetical protein
MNTPPTDTETRIQTVEKLREYDHAFLSVEDAEKLTKPFGFNARTYVATANPKDFKGLTLRGGAKSAKGIGAHELAMQICDHLGVKYPSRSGRGSQLRDCCDALEQWLNANQESATI